MSINFRGIDATVRSTKDLAELGKLLESFDDNLHVGHCGPMGDGFLVSLDIHQHPQDMDQTTHIFCDILERMPARARQLWDGADTRTFDYGLELQGEKTAPLLICQPQTLQRLLDLKVNVAVTVYGPTFFADPA